MNKQNFEPYQQVILNSILSCINIEQLHCCFNMIEHFTSLFKPLVDEANLIKATGDLYISYGDKSLLLKQ